MNLYGPVWAAAKSATGHATLTLSFASWKGGQVASTKHTLVVVKPKPRPKLEPVANLLTSLPHPEKTAQLWDVQFSKDGTKLFTFGIPSAIVQVWDLPQRKEWQRVESSIEWYNLAVFSCLSPDWKLLYVPNQSRTVKVKEKNGKKTYRYIYNGEIRVWDLTTGKRKSAVKISRDWAPSYMKLSAKGRYLYYVKQASHDRDEPPRVASMLYEVATGKRRTLAHEEGFSHFAPDGNTLLVSLFDWDSKKATLRLVQSRSGKTLAEMVRTGKIMRFDADGFSPDGSLVALHLAGEKGEPPEVWFRDGKTLADRGRYKGTPHANEYCRCRGHFTPDGKHYIVLNRQVGEIDVWDIAAQKVVCSHKLPAGTRMMWLAIGPDGHRVAVPWWHEADATAFTIGNDLRDMPQARVRIWNWRDGTAPRDLVCPPGGVAGLAFSPDGTRLAVAGTGAVHVFDVSK